MPCHHYVQDSTKIYSIEKIASYFFLLPFGQSPKSREITIVIYFTIKICKYESKSEDSHYYTYLILVQLACKLLSNCTRNTDSVHFSTSSDIYCCKFINYSFVFKYKLLLAKKYINFTYCLEYKIPEGKGESIPTIVEHRMLKNYLKFLILSNKRNTH